MLGGCYKQLTCWLLTIHSYYVGNPTLYLKGSCHCTCQSQQSLAEFADSSSCPRLLACSFFVWVYYLEVSQSARWKPTKLFRGVYIYSLLVQHPAQCDPFWSQLYLYCGKHGTSLNFMLVPNVMPYILIL